ncbi:putative bifunctional diguanylate cyclase/phosphodiesterase [Martelella radicis]|uniref:Diguanylate cyclase (GGDEF)-like protein n=1 Tax=Martelella radicis TaxID=1397476 RepID=A0A7W6KK68_9HYPH|nr:EAL domain-containing protein [Martelella radicis]MBB4122520.1 diguanylate cyclase (GGDEF)-like protein [Martelella radicis]
MNKKTQVKGRFRFLLTRAVPALTLALLIGIGVVALLVWAGKETDEASHERQARLVRLVISQLQTEVAHDQESSTVWDDAVVEVRAGNFAWIDDNLGTWMHDYFGFDGVYILDPSDRALYAFTDGAMASQYAYDAIESEVAPLAEALRAKLAAGDYSQVNEQVLTPGVSDLAVIRDRPAVVSVKPIVPHSDFVRQEAGEEHLHVAVRFLDGSLIQELQDDYMFEDLRFSWMPEGSNQPLTTSEGRNIGYFVWQPYRPGSAVMASVIPVLIGVLAIALVSIAIFLIIHHNRSKKLEESEERIRYLAMHDPLTDLPNRMYFNDRVDRRLADNVKKPLALLYLDLDRFKQVNDTLGHPAGDALISEFAGRLRSTLREDDLVARIGGDEFTVMLSGRDGEREINALCQRIVDAARKPFQIDGNTVFIGVSIGAAIFPRDGDDRINLLRKADVALYYSKTTGRGRYSFFSEAMDETLGLRRKTEMDLRQALLGENQLSVYFQPIQSARTRQIVGCEALLRWHHPEIGWISPELFIPIAEEAGLIDDIGQFALHKACAAAAKWHGLSVAVNVSGVELANPAYAGKVEKVLVATGLAPSRLELEITESVATDEDSAAVDNLIALRDLGVRIAIDDFGTGFSSLGRLQSLNIDRIKIDRSFVQGLEGKADDEAIIRAIVDIAHAKGLRTTAEGVETSQQGDTLTRMGCDDLQGFLYAQPMPLRDINRKLGIAHDTAKLDATLAATAPGDDAKD